MCSTIELGVVWSIREKVVEMCRRRFSTGFVRWIFWTVELMFDEVFGVFSREFSLLNVNVGLGMKKGCFIGLEFSIIDQKHIVSKQRKNNFSIFDIDKRVKIYSGAFLFALINDWSFVEFSIKVKENRETSLSLIKCASGVRRNEESVE